MGVRHLETFITQTVPNGSFQINIEDEIRKYNDSRWRRNAPGPTIVIDLMSLYSPIGDTNVPGSMCGGRYTLIYQRLDRFFAQFRALGATLVFFCDGLIQEDKYVTWCKRQKRKYEETVEILDAVDEGINLGAMISRFKRDFPGNTMYPVKEAAKKHGQIITAIANECDKELVQYANSVNALAIISNDSDFLIYEGFWQYWSSKDMNFETLTTKAYNRVGLLKHLGMGFQQMPLLATLGGNDVTHYDEVKQFHATLGRPSNKFYDLARFVDQQQISSMTGEKCLRQLVIQVFGKEDDELVQRFQNSLDFYDLDQRNPVQTYQNDPTVNLLLTMSNTFMYQIYMDYGISVTGFVTDLRENQVGCRYPQLAIRLEQRKVGIILYHRQDSTVMKLVTKMSHNEDYTLHMIRAEIPRHIRVPPLLDLLNKQPDIWASLLEIKLALLSWITSDTLDSRQLQPVPFILIPTVLTLYFMLENCVLYLFEADLLLQIAYDVAFERCDLLRVQYPRGEFNPRAFRIAFLYPKLYNHLVKAVPMMALDGPDFRGHPQFDGVLFHARYEEWAQGKVRLDVPHQWRLYAHLERETE